MRALSCHSPTHDGLIAISHQGENSPFCNGAGPIIECMGKFRIGDLSPGSKTSWGSLPDGCCCARTTNWKCSRKLGEPRRRNQVLLASKGGCSRRFRICRLSILPLFVQFHSRVHVSRSRASRRHLTKMVVVGGSIMVKEGGAALKRAVGVTESRNRRGGSS